MTLALQYIQSVPWMILEDYLDLIVLAVLREGSPDEIAARIKEARGKREAFENSPMALAAKQGELLKGSDRVRVVNRTALLHVNGPIFRYAGLFDDVCPVTSTEMLAYGFNLALGSNDADSILLCVNSPGGEAFGIGEFANMIATRTIDKPVLAYIGGYGASAAYYIAAAADEIITDGSSLIGSIGTRMRAVDSTRAYEQRGIKTHDYVSDVSPKKVPKLGTESGDAQMQQVVNDLGRIFVEDVARYRGTTPETVISKFGGGDVLIGKKATEAGMADRIGSFEQVLSDLSSGNYSKKKRPRMVASGQATNQNSEVSDMSAENKPTIWERVFGKKVSAEDERELRAALKEGETSAGASATQPPPAAQQQPAQSSAANASAGNSELARIQAQLETERNARFTSEANAFADLITGPGQRRAMPAERDSIVTNYMIAAQDDVANPKVVTFTLNGEANQGTRVDAFKAAYASRPPHNLTSEFVPFDASTMQALDPGASATAKMLEEARKQGEEHAASANKAGKPRG